MRQLAAILFADMTGYTALMQENEQLARTKRKRLKEVLEVSVARFNGKVLQYYGDGSLSIFSSAHNRFIKSLKERKAVFWKMFSHYQKPNEELKRVCEINY